MCVARTWDNMSFKALILGNVLNTHIINSGVACLEKFLLARKGREVILFSSIRFKKMDEKKVDFAQLSWKNYFSTFCGP